MAMFIADFPAMFDYRRVDPLAVAIAHMSSPQDNSGILRPQTLKNKRNFANNPFPLFDII